MGDSVEPIDEVAARRARKLTKQIRQATDQLWALLLEAHQMEAWRLLGYRTWDAYVRAEFDMTRGNANRLVAQGEIIAAIEAAAGTDETPKVTRARATPPPVSARQAAVIKKNPASLPAITEAVRAGVEPAAAVVDVLSTAKSNNGSGISTTDVAKEELAAEHAEPEQLTIPWAVPHSRVAAALTHDDIAAKEGAGKAKAFLRDEIARIEAEYPAVSGGGSTSGPPALSQTAPVVCAHPKPAQRQVNGGVVQCQACGLVRGRNGKWRAP